MLQPGRYVAARDRLCNVTIRGAVKFLVYLGCAAQSAFEVAGINEMLAQVRDFAGGVGIGDIRIGCEIELFRKRQ